MNEDYMVYGTNSMKMKSQMNSILNAPLFSCVSIEWEDTPGFPAQGNHGIRAFWKSAVSDYSMQNKSPV